MRINSSRLRTTKRASAAVALLAGLALAGCSTGAASGGPGAAGSATVAGQQVGTVGTQTDIQDISKFCGDKEITVAYADGFGGNSWRKTTRAIFEAEAAKCPNITKVLYTDAWSIGGTS